MIKLCYGLFWGVILFSLSASATTFTVTTTNDTGSGSLRYVIFQVNSQPGADLIVFNIPGDGPHHISPFSPLPEITDPVTIDGYTEPGASANTLTEGDNAVWKIWLDGLFGDSESPAFSVSASNVVIRGLAIQGPRITGGYLGQGIRLRSGASNRVEGCRIGPALRYGVLLESNVFAAVIGGNYPAARNVIGGNQEGITIAGSSSNRVQGNFIGTDETGCGAFGNRAGILIGYTADARGNLIGGTTPSERNIISGNGIGRDGFVGGVVLLGAVATAIQGNLIGTDVTGRQALTNFGAGIYVYGGASSNIIGGIAPGAGNVISANGGGIYFEWGHDAGGNTIQGNFIGTDITGTNRLGNETIGIASDSSYPLLIGGIQPGAGNVVSANGFFGIILSETGASGSVVQGNFIGTDRSGTMDLGNLWTGVALRSSSNLFGGMMPGAGNIVAFNGSVGVEHPGTALGNSIYANAGAGIEWAPYGPNPNDDPDEELPQNYPELSEVVTGLSQATIVGVLRSASNSNCRIEFFDNDECDASGFGEGKRYLGFTSVTTDSAGSAEFVFLYPTALPIGNYVTATATTPERGTSEFSACRAVAPPGSIDLALMMAELSDPIGLSSNITYLITVTNAGPTNATAVTVSNPLTTDFTFVSAVPSQGVCTLTDGVVTCLIGTIERDRSATITLTLQPARAGSMQNTVMVTANEPDNDPNNNTAIEQTVVGYVDLEMEIIELSGPVIAGQAVTYAFNVANRGADVATSVIVSGEIWPTSFLERSAVVSRGTCSLVNDSIYCELGDLPPGETATLTLRGVPTQSERLTVFTLATSGEFDSDLDNNNAFAVTEVADGPGVLSFSNVAWRKREDNGPFLLTVTRTGGSIGVVTLDFATSNLTAVAGADYSPMGGTLAFADGETEKTILVPLLDDELTECNETLEVSLFNPGGGARLTGTSHAQLTIIENDLVESGAAEAVSVTPDYPPTTGSGGAYSASLSDDGRFVAFVSISSNLVTNDTGSGSDVFVRDLAMGTTKWISANANGAASTESDSANPVINANGAYVAFDSSVPDLVGNDTNGFSKDVFVRDLAMGITTLVSLNTNGTASGNRYSREPAISSSGQGVAFLSRATDIGTPANTNQFVQVFVRDLAAGVTHLVSVNRFGTGGGNAHAFQPVISADGRFVAFITAASDLVENDTNGLWDVFVRDLTNNTTTLASVNLAGNGTGNGSSNEPKLSADGRHVVFTSWASDLVVGDTNEVKDVFVRDLLAGTTRLLSFNRNGTGKASLSAVISADGRYVAFASDSPDLVPGDTNGLADVFVHDLFGEITTLVSVNCNGSGSGNGASHPGGVSADGRYVTFESYATDLTPGDFPQDQFQSAYRNVFVRDRVMGVTTLVSRSIYAGGGAIADSVRPVISTDGQLVVFESGAWDLVADDRNADNDVFAWRTGSPPALSITYSNDTVLVSWPSLSPGYRLETSNDLASPDSWEPVDFISNDGTWKSSAFLNTMDNAPRFFRLRRH